MSNNIANQPKVSIIVPVYNTFETIEQCMNSLLKQNLDNIQVCLVDDGSIDKSGELCDKYIASDRRVIVIHKENGGLSTARNSGIGICTGKYLGFVDSDDYCHEDMFLHLSRKAEETGADVCICAHYTVDADEIVQKHLFSDMPQYMEKQEIIDHLIIPLIGPDIKRKKPAIEGFCCRNIYENNLLTQVPFRSEREYFAEDVVHSLELFPRAKSISIVNECLYYYRFNSDSLSNKYRQGVHLLLNNLLKWEMKYLQSNRLFDRAQDRLYATGFKFVVFSLNNLKKNKELSHVQKLEIIRSILSQEHFQKCLKSLNMQYYNWKSRLLISLCRYRLTFLIFLFISVV